MVVNLTKMKLYYHLYYLQHNFKIAHAEVNPLINSTGNIQF